MGTNYYLHTDFCPCCGKPKEKIHLGKSSCGWKFLFHKSKNIYNYESFLEFSKKGVIYNEYDDTCSFADLLELIKSKQADKTNPDCEHIDGYDFLDCDFC